MEITPLYVFLIAIIVPIYPQSEPGSFQSPCPSIFTYEPNAQQNATKESKWHGVVNLSTDIVLHSLWLNIVVDSEADILGNWVGEVTTEDNLDFKIENTKLKITPDEPLAVRFFIQYKPNKKIPKLHVIRFNGREICSTDNPERLVELFTETPNTKPTNNRYTTANTTLTTRRTVTEVKQKSTTTPQSWTTIRTENKSQSTSNTAPQTWASNQNKNNQQSKPANNVQPTSKPQAWAQAHSVNNQDDLNGNKQKTKSAQNTQTSTEKQPLSWIDTTTSKNQRTTVKSQNNQQTRNENPSPIVEIYRQTTSTTERQTNWPYGQNSQQKNSDKDLIQQSNNHYWLDNYVQHIASHNAPENVSNNRFENGNVVNPSHNNKAQNERPQSQPGSSNTERVSLEEGRPIYVRPENKPQSTQIRPNDSNKQQPVQSYNTKPGVFEIKQMKRKDSNSNANTNGGIYSEERRDTWPERDEQPKNIEPLFGSFDDTSYNKEVTDRRNVDVSGYNVRPLTTSSTPELEEDDYIPGLPSIFIPNHSTKETACGKVVYKKPTSSFASYSQKRSSMEGQWPWQIALYQQQKSTVDFKYICGGTLITRLHIITAAHCVTRKKSARVVNKVTLTVYLGKTNLRTSVDGVQIKFVNNILVHPSYNGSTYARDLAILELRDPVTFSDWVQPACLWQEDDISLKSIVGKRGSVSGAGWGFEATGTAREELSLLEMPVVDQQTCIDSYIDFYRKFTSDYTYCAGYREGTTVCNGDSGGGMVFKKGSSWYLRGVSSLSVARQNKFGCDPNRYVIFTDVAKFLPWIQDQIEDY